MSDDDEHNDYSSDSRSGLSFGKASYDESEDFYYETEAARYERSDEEPSSDHDRSDADYSGDSDADGYGYREDEDYFDDKDDDPADGSIRGGEKQKRQRNSSAYDSDSDSDCGSGSGFDSASASASASVSSPSSFLSKDDRHSHHHRQQRQQRNDEGSYTGSEERSYYDDYNDSPYKKGQYKQSGEEEDYSYGDDYSHSDYNSRPGSRASYDDVEDGSLYFTPIGAKKSKVDYNSSFGSLLGSSGSAPQAPELSSHHRRGKRRNSTTKYSQAYDYSDEDRSNRHGQRSDYQNNHGAASSRYDNNGQASKSGSNRSCREDENDDPPSEGSSNNKRNNKGASRGYCDNDYDHHQDCSDESSSCSRSDEGMYDYRYDDDNSSETEDGYQEKETAYDDDDSCSRSTNDGYDYDDTASKSNKSRDQRSESKYSRSCSIASRSRSESDGGSDNEVFKPPTSNYQNNTGDCERERLDDDSYNDDERPTNDITEDIFHQGQNAATRSELDGDTQGSKSERTGLQQESSSPQDVYDDDEDTYSSSTRPGTAGSGTRADAESDKDSDFRDEQDKLDKEGSEESKSSQEEESSSPQDVDDGDEDACDKKTQAGSTKAGRRSLAESDGNSDARDDQDEVDKEGNEGSKSCIMGWESVDGNTSTKDSRRRYSSDESFPSCSQPCLDDIDVGSRSGDECFLTYTTETERREPDNATTVEEKERFQRHDLPNKLDDSDSESSQSQKGSTNYSLASAGSNQTGDSSRRSRTSRSPDGLNRHAVSGFELLPMPSPNDGASGFLVEGHEPSKEEAEMGNTCNTASVNILDQNRTPEETENASLDSHQHEEHPSNSDAMARTDSSSYSDCSEDGSKSFFSEGNDERSDLQAHLVSSNDEGVDQNGEKGRDGSGEDAVSEVPLSLGAIIVETVEESSEESGDEFDDEAIKNDGQVLNSSQHADINDPHDLETGGFVKTANSRGLGKGAHANPEPWRENGFSAESQGSHISRKAPVEEITIFPGTNSHATAETDEADSDQKVNPGGDSRDEFRDEPSRKTPSKNGGHKKTDPLADCEDLEVGFKKHSKESNGIMSDKRSMAAIVCCCCLLLVLVVVAISVALSGGKDDGHSPGKIDPEEPPIPTQLPTPASLQLSPTTTPSTSDTLGPSPTPTDSATFAREEIFLTPDADTYITSESISESLGMEDTFLVGGGSASGVDGIQSTFALLSFDTSSLPNTQEIIDREVRAELQLTHVQTILARGPTTLTLVLLPATTTDIEDLNTDTFDPVGGIDGPLFAVNPSDTTITIDITFLLLSQAISVRANRPNQLLLMIENRGPFVTIGDRFKSRESDSSPLLVLSLKSHLGPGDAASVTPSRSAIPSTMPSAAVLPSIAPSVQPSVQPSTQPSVQPSITISSSPSSDSPTDHPTVSPTQPSNTIIFGDTVVILAEADTYLRDGDFSADSFGMESHLLVNSGPSTGNKTYSFALMSFRIASLRHLVDRSRQEISVVLRMYHIPSTTSDKEPSTLTIVRLPNANLSIESATFSTFSPSGGVDGPTMEISETASVVDKDVTDLFLHGENFGDTLESDFVLLMLENRGPFQDQGDLFYSRESVGFPPTLIVGVVDLPTTAPSVQPSYFPSMSTAPSVSSSPTQVPTQSSEPTVSINPTLVLSLQPTNSTLHPSNFPTVAPTTVEVTIPPTSPPTIADSTSPTSTPTLLPLIGDSTSPTSTPTAGKLPEEVELVADGDTFLRGGAFATDSFGTLDFLLLGSNGPVPSSVVLISFDISTLPTLEEISSFSGAGSAVLQLVHIPSASAETSSQFVLVRLPSTSLFIEALSLSTYTPVEGVVGPTFHVNPTDSILDIDISELLFEEAYLSSVPNQLLLLIQNQGPVPENGVLFRSRESASPPTLVVKFGEEVELIV